MTDCSLNHKFNTWKFQAQPEENMLFTDIVSDFQNNFYTQHVLPMFWAWTLMYWTCNSMNNLSSYCGLVDAKKGASDKNLPVIMWFLNFSSRQRYLHLQEKFLRGMISQQWQNTWMLFISWHMIYMVLGRKQQITIHPYMQGILT